MTPTEQDKELRDRVVTAVAEANLMALQEKHPIDTVETLGPVASDMANQLVDQLITADRERVALAARISELKMWELPENEIQMVFADPCNICGHDYHKLRKAQQDRLSALKAQQEEL